VHPAIEDRSCEGIPAVTVLTRPPPRAGASRLACRRTTIRPALALAEAIETTRIHHLAGRTGDRTACVTTGPFRAPRHTIAELVSAMRLSPS
jgi:predicted ATPase with chaperone activity